jgi:hypothetical protein
MKLPREFFEGLAKSEGGTLLDDSSTWFAYLCSDGVLVIYPLQCLGEIRGMFHKFQGEVKVAPLGYGILEAWRESPGPETIEVVIDAILNSVPDLSISEIIRADLINESLDSKEITYVPADWISGVECKPLVARPWLLPCQDGGLLAVLAGSVETGTSQVSARVLKISLDALLEEGFNPSSKPIDVMLRPFGEAFSRSMVSTYPDKKWVESLTKRDIGSKYH